MEKAIIVCDQVVKLQPKSVDAWKFLAVCHDKLGNKEKATQCAAKYQALVK
ncbi:MAG: hypothetical protein ACTSP5_16015 [Candidatus Heimdallarchaeota archaeon]